MNVPKDHFLKICSKAAAVAVVLTLIHSPTCMAEEFDWPAQSAPSGKGRAISAETNRGTQPRSRPTLEGCLEKVRQKFGVVDETSPEVIKCYKGWAGTTDSQIGSYGIIRARSGPGPCYQREVVTIKENGGMTVVTGPNEEASDCNRVIRPLEQSYMVTPVNIEYIRSLLGMSILTGFQAQYVDAQMPAIEGEKWTFILNGQPIKTIHVNTVNEASLPEDLRAYLNSFNAVILQTVSQ